MTTLNHWISQIEETKKLALSAATAEKSRVEIIKGQASTKFESLYEEYVRNLVSFNSQSGHVQNYAELQILLAETAFETDHYDISRKLVERYLEMEPEKDQYFCRSKLLLGEIIKKENEKAMGIDCVKFNAEAMSHVMTALSICLEPDNLPRYKFLIFNVSVTAWRILHDSLKSQRARTISEYIGKISNALESTDDPDKLWRIMYLSASAVCLEDEKQAKAASDALDKAILLGEGLLKGTSSEEEKWAKEVKSCLEETESLMTAIRKWEDYDHAIKNPKRILDPDAEDDSGATEECFSPKPPALEGLAALGYVELKARLDLSQSRKAQAEEQWRKCSETKANHQERLVRLTLQRMHCNPADAKKFLTPTGTPGSTLLRTKALATIQALKSNLLTEKEGPAAFNAIFQEIQKVCQPSTSTTGSTGTNNGNAWSLPLLTETCLDMSRYALWKGWTEVGQEGLRLALLQSALSSTLRMKIDVVQALILLQESWKKSPNVFKDPEEKTEPENDNDHAIQKKKNGKDGKRLDFRATEAHFVSQRVEALKLLERILSMSLSSLNTSSSSAAASSSSSHPLKDTTSTSTVITPWIPAGESGMEVMSSNIPAFQGDFIEEVCILAWNLAYPLLQSHTRSQVYRLFQLMAASLQALSSNLHTLRCQLHLELSVMEERLDFLQKAREEGERAKSMDYGSIPDAWAALVASSSSSAAAAAASVASAGAGATAKGKGGKDAPAGPAVVLTPPDLEIRVVPPSIDVHRPLDLWINPRCHTLTLRTEVYQTPEDWLDRVQLLLTQIQESSSSMFRQESCKKAAFILVEEVWGEFLPLSSAWDSLRMETKNSPAKRLSKLKRTMSTLDASSQGSTGWNLPSLTLEQWELYLSFSRHQLPSSSTSSTTSPSVVTAWSSRLQSVFQVMVQLGQLCHRNWVMSALEPCLSYGLQVVWNVEDPNCRTFLEQQMQLLSWIPDFLMEKLRELPPPPSLDPPEDEEEPAEGEETSNGTEPTTFPLGSFTPRQKKWMMNQARALGWKVPEVWKDSWKHFEEAEKLKKMILKALETWMRLAAKLEDFTALHNAISTFWNLHVHVFRRPEKLANNYLPSLAEITSLSCQLLDSLRQSLKVGDAAVEATLTPYEKYGRGRRLNDVLHVQLIEASLSLLTSDVDTFTSGWDVGLKGLTLPYSPYAKKPLVESLVRTLDRLPQLIKAKEAALAAAAATAPGAGSGKGGGKGGAGGVNLKAPESPKIDHPFLSAFSLLTTLEGPQGPRSLMEALKSPATLSPAENTLVDGWKAMIQRIVNHLQNDLPDLLKNLKFQEFPAELFDQWIELQVEAWCRLTRLQIMVGDILASQLSSEACLKLVSEETLSRAESSKLSPRVWRWVSLCERYLGEAIQRLISEEGQDESLQQELRLAALRHFVLAGKYGQRSRRQKLVVSAGFCGWKACQATLDSSRSGSSLRFLLKEMLELLKSSREEIDKEHERRRRERLRLRAMSSKDERENGMEIDEDEEEEDEDDDEDEEEAEKESSATTTATTAAAATTTATTAPATSNKRKFTSTNDVNIKSSRKLLPVLLQQYTLALISGYSREEDWESIMKLLTLAFEYIPVPLQKPLWKWKVIAWSKKGKSILDALQKLKEGDPRLQAGVLVTLARSSSIPKQQLTSYLQAVDILKEHLDRIDLLLEISQWMSSQGLPRGEIWEVVQSALDVLYEEEDRLQLMRNGLGDPLAGDGDESKSVNSDLRSKISSSSRKTSKSTLSRTSTRSKMSMKSGKTSSNLKGIPEDGQTGDVEDSSEKYCLHLGVLEYGFRASAMLSRLESEESFQVARLMEASQFLDQMLVECFRAVGSCYRKEHASTALLANAATSTSTTTAAATATPSTTTMASAAAAASGGDSNNSHNNSASAHPIDAPLPQDLWLPSDWKSRLQWQPSSEFSRLLNKISPLLRPSLETFPKFPLFWDYAMTVVMDLERKGYLVHALTCLQNLRFLVLHLPGLKDQLLHVGYLELHSLRLARLLASQPLEQSVVASVLTVNLSQLLQESIRLAMIANQGGSRGGAKEGTSNQDAESSNPASLLLDTLAGKSESFFGLKSFTPDIKDVDSWSLWSRIAEELWQVGQWELAGRVVQGALYATSSTTSSATSLGLQLSYFQARLAFNEGKYLECYSACLKIMPSLHFRGQPRDLQKWVELAMRTLVQWDRIPEALELGQQSLLYLQKIAIRVISKDSSQTSPGQTPPIPPPSASSASTAALSSTASSSTPKQYFEKDRNALEAILELSQLWLETWWKQWTFFVHPPGMEGMEGNAKDFPSQYPSWVAQFQKLGQFLEISLGSCQKLMEFWSNMTALALQGLCSFHVFSSKAMSGDTYKSWMENRWKEVWKWCGEGMVKSRTWLAQMPAIESFHASSTSLPSSLLPGAVYLSRMWAHLETSYLRSELMLTMQSREELKSAMSVVNDDSPVEKFIYLTQSPLPFQAQDFEVPLGWMGAFASGFWQPELQGTSLGSGRLALGCAAALLRKFLAPQEPPKPLSFASSYASTSIPVSDSTLPTVVESDDPEVSGKGGVSAGSRPGSSKSSPVPSRSTSLKGAALLNSPQPSSGGSELPHESHSSKHPTPESTPVKKGSSIAVEKQDKDITNEVGNVPENVENPEKIAWQHWQEESDRYLQYRWEALTSTYQACLKSWKEESWDSLESSLPVLCQCWIEESLRLEKRLQTPREEDPMLSSTSPSTTTSSPPYYFPPLPQFLDQVKLEWGQIAYSLLLLQSLKARNYLQQLYEEVLNPTSEVQRCLNRVKALERLPLTLEEKTKWMEAPLNYLHQYSVPYRRLKIKDNLGDIMRWAVPATSIVLSIQWNLSGDTLLVVAGGDFHKSQSFQPESLPGLWVVDEMKFDENQRRMIQNFQIQHKKWCEEAGKFGALYSETFPLESDLEGKELKYADRTAPKQERSLEERLRAFLHDFQMLLDPLLGPSSRLYQFLQDQVSRMTPSATSAPTPTTGKAATSGGPSFPSFPSPPSLLLCVDPQLSYFPWEGLSLASIFGHRVGRDFSMHVYGHRWASYQTTSATPSGLFGGSCPAVPQVPPCYSSTMKVLVDPFGEDEGCQQHGVVRPCMTELLENSLATESIPVSISSSTTTSTTASISVPAVKLVGAKKWSFMTQVKGVLSFQDLVQFSDTSLKTKPSSMLVYSCGRSSSLFSLREVCNLNLEGCSSFLSWDLLQNDTSLRRQSSADNLKSPKEVRMESSPLAWAGLLSLVGVGVVVQPHWTTTFSAHKRWYERTFSEFTGGSAASSPPASLLQAVQGARHGGDGEVKAWIALSRCYYGLQNYFYSDS